MQQPRLKENRWSKELEKALLESWKREKLYTFNPNAKNIFTIDTPPPYPSGRPWHIGAAAHYSQIDMIARTARMTGREVYFPIGIDRNGLPVERYTEKKHNIHLQDVSREKFISLCITALDDLEAEMIEIMKTMGLSGDFDNYYRTDSKEYHSLTQATFIELWRRGLIYEDTRPNNYCNECRTTIADAEITYEERPTQLVWIKFKIRETGKDLIIATTRPELLGACQTVAVNPQDEKYKEISGKHVVIPIYKRDVPIIPHPVAKPEFGSGALMICSYGDYSDVRLFRELGLQEIILINSEGKLTHQAGPYAGLGIKDARKKIVDDLTKVGLVVKTEKIAHRTPLCERSKTPIEIIPMKEWYLKQMQDAPAIRKIALKMKFYPEEHRQILTNWIDSITIDWPISRRRIYGTEIPIWYCKACGQANLPEAEKIPKAYYRPWLEQPPFKKCSACGESKGFIGEDRTFDMWMDSGISPLYISKWVRDPAFFKKTFPNTLRPQAKDIIRTWLYYTLLRCWQLTGKDAFESAWIMGYGVDEKGEKMSKSKGNVVDPIPILETHGADSFRFWAASEANLGSDFRFSETRILGAAAFLTKLWNVARFISMFPEQKTKPKLEILDEWILNNLNELLKKCIEGYEEFNFFIPSNAIREWVWNVFAPHYLELVKSRAYKGDKSALYTLHECLRTILILLAPVTPFITDHIHRAIFGKTVHKETFHEPQKQQKLPFTTRALVDLNSMIWKEKKEKGLSLKSEIKQAKIPEQFKRIESDLKATHNIREMRWGVLEINF